MWATSSSADVKVMITARLTSFNTELERQQVLTAFSHLDHSLYLQDKCSERYSETTFN